ncbi:MAG: hypothetical protein M3140_04460, partial [Actinomycetota bacterium]|nr:hypothetical protein [Actinomycetota bacterium]
MTQGRGALLTQLAQHMTRTGDSVPGAWDKFSVVAEMTALGVRVTGFRYDGERAGLPMLMDTDVIDTIADLRAASPGPNGEMFDLYIARIHRGSGPVVDQAFSAASGAGYRVTAANVSRIAELVRPGSPFLPAAPAPEPESETETEPRAEPETETEPETEPEPETKPETEPETEPGTAVHAAEVEPAATSDAATSAAATSAAATSDAADAEPSSAAAARLVAALTRDITEWVDPASAGGAGYG